MILHPSLLPLTLRRIMFEWLVSRVSVVGYRMIPLAPSRVAPVLL